MVSTMYTWNLQPPLVLGLLAQFGLYLAITGPLRRYFPDSTPVSKTQIQLFGIGWLSLFLALVSPIEVLSGYLLTMHMVQHLLITLVAAPLLLLGTPRWLFRPLLKIPGALEIGRLITGPVFAFLIYNFTFSLWHVPRFYDLALTNESIHILEHVMFLVTAALTWWPICSPMDELPAQPAGVQVLYLFLQTLPATILRALLTFADQPLYSYYTRAQRLWGLSALNDQAIAGLIMWIPGSLVFFGVLTAIFINWLSREDRDPRLA
jgi:putative membrane protein